MAAGFGHRWQGQTLGSLGGSELRRIARLLGQLLEETTGEPAEPEVQLLAREERSLILLVWRLDLRLDAHRPLGRSNRQAQVCPTDSPASTLNRSSSGTRPTTPTSTVGHGGTVGLWGGSLTGPPTPPRAE